ncbi:transposable element Tcb1 transposase [Trichonephila clavipes]|nr:transposable element Tcb1 transposase [Trichonephila clavipes]
MGICKCIAPLLHGVTLNSRQAASPLVRLVEWEERLSTGAIESRLWQRFQDNSNVSRRCSTGRARVTTPNEDLYLAVTIKTKRRSTASDLSRQLSSATGTTVSRQTVYRRLG